MFKRIISSVVGLPILIAFIVMGGIYLQLAVSVLSIFGMLEFYKGISSKILPVHFIGLTFAVLYLITLQHLNKINIMILFASFVISLLIFGVIFNDKTNIIECCVTFFGFFYVAFLMSFIFLVRDYSFGKFFVGLVFISAWGSDTFAYFTGITIGKHKLCPKLSPKKTIEGSIGGVVGATILGIIYGFVVNYFYSVNDFNTTLFFAIVCAVGAVSSQFGDLAASTIKRFTGIKDYGHIIPGHGGILDRFDSILFTAPGVYIVMCILLMNKLH